jgi:hypothetical protein
MDTLPVREGDHAVRAARGAIRVPAVIVAVNYARVPKKRPKLSATATAARFARVGDAQGVADSHNVQRIIAAAKLGVSFKEAPLLGRTSPSNWQDWNRKTDMAKSAGKCW